MGTPLYQYGNINSWRLCPPPLRDTFALAALMFEAVVNENRSPKEYEIFMSREESCVTFTDFYKSFQRGDAQRLVQEEHDFYADRVRDKVRDL